MVRFQILPNLRGHFLLITLGKPEPHTLKHAHTHFV